MPPKRIDPSKLKPVMLTKAAPSAQESNWDKLFGMLSPGGVPAQPAATGGGGGGGASPSGGDAPTTAPAEKGYPGGDEEQEPEDELDIFSASADKKDESVPEPGSDVDIEAEPEIDIEAEPEGDVESEPEPDDENTPFDTAPLPGNAKRRFNGMGMLPAQLPWAPAQPEQPVRPARPARSVQLEQPVQPAQPTQPVLSTGAKIGRAAACFGLGLLIGAVLFND